MMSMMLPLVLFVAIFYFLIVRPQKKKQKAHDDMLASISRGATVITAGGFWGKVCEILYDSYIIDLSRPDGEPVKVRILKSSVMMKKTEGDKAEHPKKKKIKKSHSASEETTTNSEAAEVKEAETEAPAQPVTEEAQQPAAETPSEEGKA